VRAILLVQSFVNTLGWMPSGGAFPLQRSSQLLRSVQPLSSKISSSHREDVLRRRAGKASGLDMRDTSSVKFLKKVSLPFTAAASAMPELNGIPFPHACLGCCRFLCSATRSNTSPSSSFA
jgi:hypothetical protein